MSTLIKNLEDRFRDISAIAAFDIFNPAKLPIAPTDDDMDSFLEYGNTQIEELSTQYQGVVASSECCLEEWNSYRQYLRESCVHLKHSEVIQDLCTNQTVAAIFPNMSALAKICRVVPVHTADVERTFSQLKLIKIRIRNRMQEKTLDSLLRIAIEGPSVEQFPLKEAVTLWAKKKKRRLTV